MVSSFAGAAGPERRLRLGFMLRLPVAPDTPGRVGSPAVSSSLSPLMPENMLLQSSSCLVLLAENLHVFMVRGASPVAQW